MLNFSRQMPFTLSDPDGNELSYKDYKDKLCGYSGKIRCKNKPYRIIEEMNEENGFVEKIENIRKNYRNKAAHTNNVSRALAEECYHTIIGKEDADKLIVDTHNAIQWLYELIDIDKLIALEVS